MFVSFPVTLLHCMPQTISWLRVGKIVHLGVCTAFPSCLATDFCFPWMFQVKRDKTGCQFQIMQYKLNKIDLILMMNSGLCDRGRSFCNTKYYYFGDEQFADMMSH